MFASVGMQSVSFEGRPGDLASAGGATVSQGRGEGRCALEQRSQHRAMCRQGIHDRIHTVGGAGSAMPGAGADVGAVVAASRACVALFWLAPRRILAEETAGRSLAGPSVLSSCPRAEALGGMVACV